MHVCVVMVTILSELTTHIHVVKFYLLTLLGGMLFFVVFFLVTHEH